MASKIAISGHRQFLRMKNTKTHLFTVPASGYVPTTSTSPILFVPAGTDLAVKLLKLGLKIKDRKVCY